MKLANLTRGNDRGATSLRLLLSMALISFSAAAGFVGLGPTHANAAADYICDRTGSHSNPYVVNRPSNSGQLSGHLGHTGPVWFLGIAEPWGDIIPPQLGAPDGLNWDTAGQEIWGNNCSPVYPDLAIVKTSSGNGNEGGSGSYFLNVSNLGNGTAFGTVAAPLVVRDTMPTGVVATSASGNGWDCTVAAAGAGITCNRESDVAPGTAAGQITVAVTWESTGSKTNTATVDAARGEKVMSNNTSTITTTVAGPSLSGTVVKTSDADGDGTWTDDETTSAANAAVTFRATVTNTSGVTVDLGALSDNYGAAPGTTITPDCAATKPATLVHNASYTCEFTVPAYTAAAGGSVSNTFTATLSKTGSSDATPSDSAIVRTSVLDLSLTKSGPATRTTGQSGNYTLVVENVGTAPATNTITVTDTLPTGVTAANTSSGGFACTVAGSTVTCVTNDDIAVGGTKTITLPATFTTTGSKVNSATVSMTGDSNANNDTDTATTAVSNPVINDPTPLPSDLAVDKAGPASANPGDTITWTLTVTSKGPGTATGFTVTDTVPDGVTLTALSGTGFSCTLATAACTYAGSLAAGSSAVVTVVGDLADDIDAASITNTVVVAPSDGTPADNTDSVVTVVQALPGQADLVLDKSGPSDAVFPGDTITWAIRVTNAGTEGASGFTVTDQLASVLALGDVVGDGFTCTGESISCTYDGTLAPGDSVLLLVSSTLDDGFTGSSVSNTATVPLAGDPTPGNNTDSAIVGVNQEIGGGVVEPGTGEQPSPSPSPAPNPAPNPAPSPLPATLPFADEEEETETPASLPFTGSTTDLLLGLGAGLSVIGLLLALTGRRRRTVS